MVTAPFESRPIIDIVRSDPSLVTALADSGITPRYLYWTVEAAARDLDLNLDQLVRRLAASVTRIPAAQQPWKQLHSVRHGQNRPL